jgi:hypothetical protein
MTKLNQLIAVEKGTKDELNREITDAYHLIGRPDAVTGISRAYKPYSDETEDMLPPEARKVQVKTEDVLGAVAQKWARLLDVVAAKDITNTQATANLVVDSDVIVPDVPVTTLLWLEKQLNDLSTFIGKLPTLDLARDWTFNEQQGVYEAETEWTKRNIKVMRNHVIAEATDKHPAQVQVFNEDVPVGIWETKHFSGAITEMQKQDLKEKVSALQKAVKFAREEANSIDVTDKNIGEKIFDWLLS